MGELFSMDGRYNRAKYFWTTLLIGIVAQIIAFLIGLAAGAAGGDPATVGGVIGLIVGIGSAVICAFQVVKRLHDLDRPGTHYWLLLIPLYNIYLGLLLLFKKGTEGANQYGPDPLMK